ncbi:MAG: NAD-dependent epimerase/dehydratase family protein [Cytophagales bacterium]|nr:NAD-dependent epimerase/dehydratase family protein [Cytophagales bacterium]
MRRKERVLVTGANGLLGANIISQLIKYGYEAIAMVRRGSNQKSLNGLKCDVFEGSFTSMNDLSEIIPKCEYVIHAAARTKHVPNDWQSFQESNVDGTAMLIAYCKNVAIKRFIYVSSANCFANGSIDSPGDETGKFMQWLKGSGYAWSKYLGQKMVIQEFKRNNFPGLVVAPTFIIGERDARPSSGQLLLYILKNRMVFYPPGGKSFVDADFASNAIVNALTYGRLGHSYLIAGENMTYKDFYLLVKKTYKLRQIHFTIPGPMLKLAGYIGTLIEKVFRISLPLNHVNQRLICLDNYFSGAKAQEELHLKPTDIENSIFKSIKWFDQNGMLT